MFVITYMSLMMSFTFNIFIFCYIGELVAEQVLANDTLRNLSRRKFQQERIKMNNISKQCSKVGEMTYMIDWYRLTGRKKLGCILIIAMSNSSTKFTAGNMVELSINTFSDVSIKIVTATYSNLRINKHFLNE